MTRHVWPIFVLFCACGTATTSPPAPPAPPAEQPSTAKPIAYASAPLASTTESAPVPAKPPPMQIVLSELANDGWKCVPRPADLPTIDCPADAAHKTAMRITYSNADSGCSSDEPCFLRLVSYDAPRAFGTPCEKFEDAMSDLTIAAHHFSVTCNDTTNDPTTSQEFGFVTSITVTDPSHPGITEALPAHRADRAAAIQKLVSVKAIRRTSTASTAHDP